MFAVKYLNNRINVLEIKYRPGMGPHDAKETNNLVILHFIHNYTN